MPYKDPEVRRKHKRLRAQILRAAMTPEERRKFYQEKVKPKADLVRKKNAEARRAQFRRWYHERGGKEQTAAKRNGDPETILGARKRDLLRHFGLTMDGYQALVESQNGVCKICSGPPGKRSLAVDHCHETGKIRGLLCYRCNVGIGFFQEDLDRMTKAIAYIRSHREAN